MQALVRPHARMDEIEIDEVLQFCERVLGNVPMPWKGLQPEGVSYDPKNRLSNS
jgi:hypothetical protein